MIGNHNIGDLETWSRKVNVSSADSHPRDTHTLSRLGARPGALLRFFALTSSGSKLPRRPGTGLAQDSTGAFIAWPLAGSRETRKARQWIPSESGGGTRRQALVSTAGHQGWCGEVVTAFGPAAKCQAIRAKCTHNSHKIDTLMIK
jgi:hypothetical protein